MIGFLHEPKPSAAGQRLQDEDLEELGYVMNVSRLWAYRPELVDGLFALMRQATAGVVDFRARAVLVTACASAFGDAYCSLAWGGKLAGASDAATAAGVITGDDDALTSAERALARWARAVARDPNTTGVEDVAALRVAGISDDVIFAVTVFVALRIAFSTVNDALGLSPDAELTAGLAPAVRQAVTFGRQGQAP